MRIIQNLFPLLDTFIVGKVLDLGSLSAVGVASSLYSLFNDTLFGLISGFAIIVSKKSGSESKKELTRAFYISLFSSVILCIIASGIGIVFSEQLLSLLKTPAELITCAKQYIVIMLLGFIINVLYNFIGEMLRAIGNSRIPLYLLIISSGVHAILLYPLTLRFGVCGTAITTLISYSVAVACGAIYIFIKEFPLFVPSSAIIILNSPKTPISCANAFI